MSDNKGLVSIIIPTYKQRGGLKKSIDSALNQTYKYIEVIVVDDNDPDTNERRETEMIINGYSGDPRVIYIKHEVNKNGAAARNTGIRNAKGDYIAFLDDDDLFLPQKIEKQIEFLEFQKKYDAVYNLVSINGKVVKSENLSGNLLKELLMEQTAMFTSSLLFRKEALKTIGGFDENFRRHQDYELMVKYFLQGYEVGCIQEVLTEYSSMGGNNVRGKKLEDLKKQFLSQFEDAINRLEEEKKGTKKIIIGSNYAYVFVSHIVNKEYYFALKLFIKYGLFYTKGFISYLHYFIKLHLA